MRKISVFLVLLTIIASIHAHSSDTFDSDFGMLKIYKFMLPKYPMVFSYIDLTGFQEEDKSGRLLTDFDGFFSLMLLTHAFRHEMNVPMNFELIFGLFTDLRNVSVLALKYLQGKLTDYRVKPNVSHQAIASFDQLLGAIPELLHDATKLTDSEWFSRIAAMLAPHAEHFNYSVDKIVLKVAACWKNQPHKPPHNPPTPPAYRQEDFSNLEQYRNTFPFTRSDLNYYTIWPCHSENQLTRLDPIPVGKRNFRFDLSGFDVLAH